MFSPDDIKTVCVCGAGAMGSGIAQACAQAGYTTIQFDLSKEMLDKSKATIAASLQKLAEKNKISADEQEAAVSRILFTNNIEDCIADIIIEAIIEKKEAKIDLFNKLAVINASQ